VKLVFAKSISKLNPSLPISGVQAYAAFMRQSGRIAIYAWPAALILWIYLVFPDVGLSLGKSDAYELIAIIPLLLLLIILHEFIHLIALPHKILHKETSLVVNVGGPILHWNLAIKFGGSLSRNQFIWSTLLPFMLLSAAPFLLAAFSSVKPPLAVGILAAANVGLSVADIMQATLILTHVRSNQRFGA